MPKKPPPWGRRLTEHANGLATIAVTVCLTVPAPAVAQQALGITCLPRPVGGVLIWDARRQTHVLHVDDQGQVYCYQPSLGPEGWERRLVDLAPQVGMPIGQLQVTVRLNEHELREAAAYARSRHAHYTLTPLERIGQVSLDAARALMFPSTR